MPPNGSIHIFREPGGSYRLTTELVLSHSVGEIFDFFSDPYNLPEITPAWLGLRVVSQGVEMRRGACIRYRFRVRGVPASWRSEITVWEPPHRFVDQQRRGPFRMWSHEHAFEALGDRTRAIDEVRYRVPGGRLTHEAVVRRDVTRLFEHRHRRLREIFQPHE